MTVTARLPWLQLVSGSTSAPLSSRRSNTIGPRHRGKISLPARLHESDRLSSMNSVYRRPTTSSIALQALVQLSEATHHLHRDTLQLSNRGCCKQVATIVPIDPAGNKFHSGSAVPCMSLQTICVE